MGDAAKWIKGYMRGYYPYMLGCAAIGLMSIEQRWTVFIVAAIVMAFAIDLAQTQSEAQTKSDFAGMLVNKLAGGGDSTITITFDYEALNTKPVKEDA